jgi:hypothetical protein
MSIEHLKDIMNSIKIGDNIEYIYMDHNNDRFKKNGTITEIKKCCLMSKGAYDFVCREICIGFIGIDGREPECMITPNNESKIKQILYDIFDGEDFLV